MELKDYSGDFKPNLTLNDFTKEQLIQLIEVAGKGLVGIDGLWNTIIKEKYGWQTARDLQDLIWIGPKNFNAVQDVPRITKAFNISERNVKGLFKYLQVTPSLGMYNWPMRLELINDNHGILTITKCKTLEYCERAKDDKLKNYVCKEMDSKWFGEIAPHCFNPKIKVNQLVPVEMRPKRSDCGENLCQWEYVLAE